MKHASKKTITVRLKRIEGQVRGIARMVEDDRYCIDVLTQIAAVCAALRKVEQDILKDHVSCCVAGAFKHGTTHQQQEKLTELTTILAKISK
jgi:DNA-binding FrmR family transcriptional regulator